MAIPAALSVIAPYPTPAGDAPALILFFGKGRGVGAEPPQNLPSAAAVVRTVLPLKWNGHRARIVLGEKMFYTLGQ